MQLSAVQIDPVTILQDNFAGRESEEHSAFETMQHDIASDGVWRDFRALVNNKANSFKVFSFMSATVFAPRSCEPKGRKSTMCPGVA